LAPVSTETLVGNAEQNKNRSVANPKSVVQQIRWTANDSNGNAVFGKSSKTVAKQVDSGSDNPARHLDNPPNAR
jgi:hypothetical protein